MDDFFYFFLVAVLVWWLVFCFIQGAWRIIQDRNRIEGDIAKQGGRVISIRGSGIVLSWLTRRYRVEYVARDGQRRVARCKTSYYAGVQWLDDQVA